MELLRKELLSISNAIRKLMRSKKYNRLYYLLGSVTGIGPLTAASLLTEIGDMHRFKIFTTSIVLSVYCRWSTAVGNGS
ncbi:MAG: transposase [Chitinophagaceae bacterium]|nr:transposase [Chitinophagaceae bacterium]